MDNVNIYINQTHRSPRQSKGAYQYLISIMTNKGLADTKGFGVVEATAHEAELIALRESLKRFTKPCILNIHSEHGYISQIVNNNWMQKWKENGFKNAKGIEVAHAELLKDIDALLTGHEIECADNNLDEFTDWMRNQLEINYKEVMKGDMRNVKERFWRIQEC